MLILNRNNEEILEFIPTPEQALDMYKKKAQFTNTDIVTIVEDYYDFLVTNSLFYKLDLAYLVISDKGTSAERLPQYKINAINPRKFGLKYYNGPTANATGIKWTSASQQYANTGFVPKKHAKRMTVTNACAGIYQTTNAGNSCDFGTNSKAGSNPSFAMSSNLGNDLYDAINGPIMYNTTPDATIGFNTMIRENSTDTIRTRVNGVASKLFTPFADANGFPDLPILIGALGPISNNIFSNNEFNHMFIGSFSTAELAAYETYVNTMQGNIETALSLSAGTRKKY